MNKAIVDAITIKINQDLATKEDYIALIKEVYSPTPWAIEPCIGIFNCRFGMTNNLQESFKYVSDFFVELVKMEHPNHAKT